MNQNIQTYIISDSEEHRKIFSKIVNKTPNVDLIGRTANVQTAFTKMRKFHVDVILLDIFKTT